MKTIVLGVALSALFGLLALLLLRSRRQTSRTSRTSPTPRRAAAPEGPSANAVADAMPASARPSSPQPQGAGRQDLPPALLELQLLRARDLAPDRRAAFVAVFRDLPRPPRLLHQLLSPDFVRDASTAQLVDLIQAEPLFAAKVLAAVNSALYGLSRPVARIEQAVTYLGLDGVRSVCLQYMLISSFRADSPKRQRMLDTTWAASAMASELARRLAPETGLDERGAIVSAVVLSFLGRLAIETTTPAGILAQLPPRDLPARLAAEQRTLGLCSAEIGRLLMTDWGLPERVVDDAATVDTTVLTPAPGLEGPGRALDTRRALAHLCARLGERLAHGELHDLSDFDLAADDSVELHTLRQRLDHPALARLPTLLRQPALVEGLHGMAAGAAA